MTMATNGNGSTHFSHKPAPVLAPPSPAVAFLLYNLPYEFSDDFYAPLQILNIHEQLDDLLDKISATYHRALATVLGSSLNEAGMVQAVYINLWEEGCFEMINPQADSFKNVTPGALESMLRKLLDERRIVNPQTNEESWREVHGMNALLSSLPANKHIIGCVSGEASQNSTNYRDYIRASPVDQTFLLAVLKNFKDR